MMKLIFLGLCLLSLGVHGQFPWMNLGLQNLGANIQAMTQNIVANSINQAQSSFQAGIADKIRRAEAAGTTFDFSELRPGEFRQFTDREGNTRGFSHRSADGLSSMFCLFSSGQDSTYLFSNGPRGNQVMTF